MIDEMMASSSFLSVVSFRIFSKKAVASTSLLPIAAALLPVYHPAGSNRYNEGPCSWSMPIIIPTIAILKPRSHCSYHTREDAYKHAE